MRWIWVALHVVLALVIATDARAQLTPAPSESASAAPPPVASSAPAPPTSAPVAPAAAPTETSKPRPDPGPSVKERGSRARRTNPASGPLFLAVLIGAMAYYVIKKIRKRM